MGRPPGGPAPPPGMEKISSTPTPSIGGADSGTTPQRHRRPKDNKSSSTTRKRPKRRERRPHPKGRSPSSQLHLPHVKVTLRNIGNVERHGTSRQLLDMVRSLIIQSSSSTTSIHLEEALVQRLVLAEELAAAAAAEAKDVETTNDNDDKEVEQGEKETKPNDTMMEQQNKSAEKVAMVIDATPDSIQNKDAQPSAAAQTDNAIAARVLYVVPPKKSRRRGEKSGYAYLVLTAPKPPQLVQQPSSSEAAPVVLTPAERSRIVAQGRLVLLLAVEALTAVAKEDARTKQLYGGCIVEQSKSQKTWKEHTIRDRRDGTLEQTEDYKRFLEKQSKSEEDRLARPKPTPGGATVEDAATLENNGQQLSAIVLHLRAKREEMKAKRKKTNNTTAPAASIKTKSSTKKTTEDRTKKSKKDRRGKEEKRAKKKSAKRAARTVTSPTLLKPDAKGEGKKTRPRKQPAAQNGGSSTASGSKG